MIQMINNTAFIVQSYNGDILFDKKLIYSLTVTNITDILHINFKRKYILNIKMC